MATNDEIYAARKEVEESVQKLVRLTYDGTVGNMYVQDFVICVASESMDPGHENTTYMNNFNRLGMAKYQCMGLLVSALKKYSDE